MIWQFGVETWFFARTRKQIWLNIDPRIFFLLQDFSRSIVFLLFLIHTINCLINSTAIHATFGISSRYNTQIFCRVTNLFHIYSCGMRMSFSLLHLWHAFIKCFNHYCKLKVSNKRYTYEGVSEIHSNLH